METGKKIKEIREYFGLTQKKLADILGVRQQMVDYYEKKKSIDSDKLKLICDRLDISAIYFFTDLPFKDLHIKSAEEHASKVGLDDGWINIFRKVSALGNEDKGQLKKIVNAFLSAKNGEF